MGRQRVIAIAADLGKRRDYRQALKSRYGLMFVKRVRVFLTIFLIRMLRVNESTMQGTRDAGAFAATMDHVDIRGLITAIHLSVAGLPRSKVGDHHADAHIALSRIPLVVLAPRVTRALWREWNVRHITKAAISKPQMEGMTDSVG
jgi:hypothetical protein